MLGLNPFRFSILINHRCYHFHHKSPMAINISSMVSKVLGHLFLWGSLGLSSSVSAQEVNPSNIAMWKIQSTQNTVYLLGSVHVGIRCSLESPRIDQAMAEAEHVVFEIDFDTIKPTKQIELSLDIAKIGKLRPNEPTLKESVDAPTYEAIRQKFDALKPDHLAISLDTLNTLYHPAFIAFQIQGFKAIAQGLSGECGIDKILTNKAKSANKSILALETFDQQKKLITQIIESTRNVDINEQIRLALNDDPTNMINGLVSSVLNGKIEDIETQVIESCQSTPQICYQVLDVRNQAWLKTIQTYLQDEDDYFIVVGAAHMVGPQGLITLLENANYNIKPF